MLLNITVAGSFGEGLWHEVGRECRSVRLRLWSDEAIR